MRPIRERLSVDMTLWLAFVWILLFRSLEPLVLLSSFLVAVLVQLCLPLPTMGTRWRLRPVWLLVLVAHFLSDVVRAGLGVAWIIVRRRQVDNAVIRVPLTSREPVHITLVCAMTSLIPGSLVVRADTLRGIIHLHVLDVNASGGPEGVRHHVLAVEERLLRAVSPRGRTTREYAD